MADFGSAFKLQLPLLATLLIVASFLPNSSSSPSPTEIEHPMFGGKIGACSTGEFEQAPCRCCKMGCWYTIAKSATHELGHIPGQEGEEEALATLKLIRACMILECTPLCQTQKRSTGRMFVPPFQS